MRRILCLWFPRLAAERVLRDAADLGDRPLAVVSDRAGLLTLASLSIAAEAVGLRRGMRLVDARAIRPDLVTCFENLPQIARTHAALHRWAGRFSPWVALEPEGVVLDVTGSTHLFGGEAALVSRLEAEAAGFGFTLQAGLADTRGGAWALSRYAMAGPDPTYAGDAIDQEARATRARAAKRRWERGGLPPVSPARVRSVPRIVPPGGTRAAIAPLPVIALRLSPRAAGDLAEVGLRRIGDLYGLPRASLARSGGLAVVTRLDQALGITPEPIAPDPPEPVHAASLRLPEPIGRTEDVLAAIDRLLASLVERLRTSGSGARRLRLTLRRTDGSLAVLTLGLARPVTRAETMRPLLALRLDGLDAGFGFESLQLEATAVDRLPAPGSAHAPLDRMHGPRADPAALTDLIDRLGARLGVEAITGLHPVATHIPERGTVERVAAVAPPARGWPDHLRRNRPAGLPVRPILLFPPEPIAPTDEGRPPACFLWRRRPCRRMAAFGPERIAPEWWRDDPAWHSGPRDYWRVETETGLRLWLFETLDRHPRGDRWFAQGIFA